MDYEDDDSYLTQAFCMNAGAVLGALVALPFPAAIPFTGAVGAIVGGRLAHEL